MACNLRLFRERWFEFLLEYFFENEPKLEVLFNEIIRCSVSRLTVDELYNFLTASFPYNCCLKVSCMYRKRKFYVIVF